MSNNREWLNLIKKAYKSYQWLTDSLPIYWSKAVIIPHAI